MALRVFVLGATGTIGRAAVTALLQQGHEVVCLVRAKAGVGGALTPDGSARLLEGAALRIGDVRDPQSLARDGFAGVPGQESDATGAEALPDADGDTFDDDGPETDGSSSTPDAQ